MPVSRWWRQMEEQPKMYESTKITRHNHQHIVVVHVHVSFWLGAGAAGDGPDRPGGRTAAAHQKMVIALA